MTLIRNRIRKKHPKSMRSYVSKWNGFAPIYTGVSHRDVCFKCRLCFHNGKSNNRVCPECKGAMIDCGVHFRAPKRRNIREWKLLETIVTRGVLTWFSTEGSGQLPKTVKDAIRVGNGNRLWREVHKVTPARTEEVFRLLGK